MIRVHTTQMLFCGLLITLAVPFVKYVPIDASTAFAFGWGLSGLALLLCASPEPRSK